MAELESEPTHYFLMCGYDECHDGDEWIGIYDSLAQLKSAYKAAVQVLEQEHKQYGESNWAAEHEKVMINTYHEATGKWHYDIPYEVLFPEKKDRLCNEYKAVKIVLRTCGQCTINKSLYWKLTVDKDAPNCMNQEEIAEALERIQKMNRCH